MAENTTIEWCRHTFNPWQGCTKVSEGCRFCYAEALMDKRWGKVRWGPNGTRVKTSEANWREPLKWNRQAQAAGERRRVFCASLADVFEDWQGPMHDSRGVMLLRENMSGMDESLEHVMMADIRASLFAIIDQTPWLDWLILTKRPENIRRMWCSHINTDGLPPSKLHRKNVWLLTSVSNQETAERQWEHLEQCADLAPVLGFSAEPLLGPIDFPATWRNGRLPDWIIVGCESNGSKVGNLGAFRDEVHWRDAACQILEQCEAADVAAFAKQLPINGRVSHDMDDWPPLMRVRQYPATAEPASGERVR